jgi:hypothetical protein
MARNRGLSFMSFKINLPYRLDVYFIRTAGLEAGAYLEAKMGVILKKAKPPLKVPSRYFLSEKPSHARITILEVARHVSLEIEAEEAGIETRIREHLSRYSAENNGDALHDAENRQLWDEIEKILEAHDLSSEALLRGAVMPRAAMRSLMELCEKTVWYRRDNIHNLFAERAVAKPDRAFAAGWLIKEFEAEKDPDGQASMRIWDLAVPQIAEDLIRLIQDRRFGNGRGPLCMGLAKTKHPRAAEVIASVLEEDGMAWAVLQALAKLKAAQYADSVRKFLRHSDADVRREAKKALKKFGVAMETAPLPVHLVKGRRSFPNGLAEWSANLDMEDLEPTLAALARCVESGFGPTEIAEVVGVVEETRHDQSKMFCFPITAAGRMNEVWLSVFMDDIDSPDLGIYGSQELIQKLKETLPD